MNGWLGEEALIKQVQQNQIFTLHSESHLIYLTMRPANPQGVPSYAVINTPDFYVNDVNKVFLEDGFNYGACLYALNYMAGYQVEIHGRSVS